MIDRNITLIADSFVLTNISHKYPLALVSQKAIDSIIRTLSQVRLNQVSPTQTKENHTVFSAVPVVL